MKINNKLIAGGLMTVVACALTGSITGTFAWYQYSNNSTVSMHGVALKTSQNLYINNTTENLGWDDIKGQHSGNFRPTTNGANDGSSSLGAKWYSNPDGVNDELPEVASADLDLYRFTTTLHAQLKEKVGSGAEEGVAGKIYISDIAGLASSPFAKAVTMYIEMGNLKCVVSPTEAGDVALEATYSYEREYVDFDAEETVNVEYDMGTLVRVAHSTVVGKAHEVDLPAAGIDITLTVWLEGFAILNGDTDNWWDENISEMDFYAGIELTAYKA